MNEHHGNTDETMDHDQGFEPGFGMELPVEYDEDPGGLESMRNVSRRRQRLLLVAVVVCGIGAVWVLKILGGGMQEASGDTVMEQLIDHFISDSQVDEHADSAEAVESSEQTLLVLQESYQQQQIPVEGLRCNPFLLSIYLATSGDDGHPAPDNTELQRTRRMEELHALVADLAIDSTLTGARPMARIGGELVMEGSTLAGTPDNVVVTLVHVDRGVVTLEAVDPVLGLSGRWQRNVGR